MPCFRGKKKPFLRPPQGWDREVLNLPKTMMTLKSTDSEIEREKENLSTHIHFTRQILSDSAKDLISKPKSIRETK
jgi:hypothetical protein